MIDGSPLRFLCKQCFVRLPWIDHNRCYRCGNAIFGHIIEGEKICARCDERNPSFDMGYSIFHFQGPARDWVHHLKYRKGTFLRKDIWSLVRLSPALGSFLNRGCLVPVPLHVRKERERGFNQSYMISKELSRLNQNLTTLKLLRRVVDTESQTSFNRNWRLKNVKNAFAVVPKTAINPSLRYILVDDVFTTGATLEACAHVLKQAGAKRVDIFTLAHG